MRATKGLILWFVVFWLTFLVLGDVGWAAARSWYVDAWVPQSGDGTSWEKAFKTIQEGINAASDGDTVTVAQGTYPENVQFKGKNIVLTGTDVLNPDVIAKTIIQGRQLGPTVTFSGSEKPSCWLTGFTVWDGKAGSGGAIRGNGTHATIGMNVITGGTADSYGGGLYECHGLICLNVITVNSSGEGGGGLAFCNGPIQFNIISLCWSWNGGALHKCLGPIQNNTITDCVASGNGGGLSDCDGYIFHNNIINCAASNQGGGLFECDGDILNNTITKCSADIGGGLAFTAARIANNTITENKASSAYGAGGGLWACHGTIENNSITKNSAHNDGGGLACCTGPIQTNLIALNSADDSGGGLYGCYEFIRNNLVTANRAGAKGGGLYHCTGDVENNTITGNVADEGGGLSDCRGYYVRNCIVWGNHASDGSQVSGRTWPTYCCIQDWTGGDWGNIALDPQLSDPDGPDDDPLTIEDNDCRLELNSPCIDAGENDLWMWGAAVDLDGNVRIVRGTHDTKVDMGAYEYGSFRFTIVSVEQTSSNQLKLAWTSRPGDTYVVTSSTVPNRPDWFQEGSVLSQGASTSLSVNMGTAYRSFYRIEMAH